MTVTGKGDNTGQLDNEASAWFLSRGGGTMCPAQEAAFAEWLARSPQHEEAYDAVEAIWSAASQLERHPSFETTRRWAIAAAARGRATRRVVLTGLAAAVVCMGGLAVYLQAGPKPLAAQSFRTAVGQQATITLPDGSQVTLNTDTRLRTETDEDKRLVYLERGQAFFRVAKDPRRPFVVNAAGRTVTAIGTAFDVRVDRGALKVVLVEGKVRVESAKPSPAREIVAPDGARPAAPPPPVATEMSAGTQLVAPDEADWRVTRTDTARATSWLDGRLFFDGVGLADVVEELNRYSTRKMVIVDPSLAKFRMSGNFTPGDVHGFSQALRVAGVADLREEPDGGIRIVPLQ